MNPCEARVGRGIPRPALASVLKGEHNIGKRKQKIKKITLSGVGFEPTPPFGDQNTRSHCVMGRYCNLESGALDRSAILTDVGNNGLYFSCSEIARKENDWVLIIIPYI